MSNISLGGGVVDVNGICLHTSTFHRGAGSATTVHPGAASATFILVMETFCIYAYVVCHGLCGLYIVVVSRTIFCENNTGGCKAMQT